MSEFTKGPWITFPRSSGYPVDVIAPQSQVSIACVWANDGTEKMLPNARLIAEAPAMFELLEKIAGVIVTNDSERENRDSARALIARVEPFGLNTHAGVWIDRETSDKISRDGA